MIDLNLDLCTTCFEPYEHESPGCEEHTEWRIEQGVYDD